MYIIMNFQYICGFYCNLYALLFTIYYHLSLVICCIAALLNIFLQHCSSQKSFMKKYEVSLLKTACKTCVVYFN